MIRLLLEKVRPLASTGYPYAIDYKLCKRCGICIAFCPKQVYERGEDGAPQVVRPEECIQCRMCFLRCPDFAIRPEVNQLG